MYPLRHQEQQDLRTTLTLLTNQRASQSANFGRVLSWSLFAKKAIDLAYLMRARTGSCSSARSTTTLCFFLMTTKLAIPRMRPFGIRTLSDLDPRLMWSAASQPLTQHFFGTHLEEITETQWSVERVACVPDLRNSIASEALVVQYVF